MAANAESQDSAASSQNCSQCDSKKAVSTCGLCQKELCKSCRQTLDAKNFSLLLKRPEHLNHSAYCSDCFDLKVAPDLAEYEDLENKADDVYFLSKNFRGSVHIYEKHTKTIFVEKCDDRRQLILMLAYQAAKLNFNAIISADIKSKKINAPGGYEYSEWSGSAIPANIDGPRFEASSLRGI